MYQQTSWLTGYKIPSVTVSVGHSQPSQFLLHTALEIVLRGTVFFEQQKDLSSTFFLFNGQIDHENKADDKENNNANKKTVRLSSSALSSLPCSDPSALDSQECVPVGQKDLQEQYCEQTATVIANWADILFWDQI